MTRPVDVLGAYNEVMTRFGYAHRTRSGRKALSEANKLLVWCTAHDIDDVGAYIAARQEALRYAGVDIALSLSKLASATPEFLANYRLWGANRQAAERGQRDLIRKTEDDEPRHSGALRVLWEHMKQTYHRSGDQVICRLSRDVTGGYNYRSNHCRTCVQARACFEELPEALRRSRVRSV